MSLYEKVPPSKIPGVTGDSQTRGFHHRTNTQQAQISQYNRNITHARNELNNPTPSRQKDDYQVLYEFAQQQRQQPPPPPPPPMDNPFARVAVTRPTIREEPPPRPPTPMPKETHVPQTMLEDDLYATRSLPYYDQSRASTPDMYLPPMEEFVPPPSDTAVRPPSGLDHSSFISPSSSLSRSVVSDTQVSPSPVASLTGQDVSIVPYVVTEPKEQSIRGLSPANQPLDRKLEDAIRDPSTASPSVLSSMESSGTPIFAPPPHEEDQQERSMEESRPPTPIFAPPPRVEDEQERSMSASVQSSLSSRYSMEHEPTVEGTETQTEQVPTDSASAQTDPYRQVPEAPGKMGWQLHELKGKLRPTPPQLPPKPAPSLPPRLDRGRTTAGVQTDPQAPPPHPAPNSMMWNLWNQKRNLRKVPEPKKPSPLVTNSVSTPPPQQPKPSSRVYYDRNATTSSTLDVSGGGASFGPLINEGYEVAVAPVVTFDRSGTHRNLVYEAAYQTSALNQLIHNLNAGSR